jgi:hypothetical protein
MKKSKVKELIKESVGGESIRTEDEYGSIFFKLPNGKLHRENGPAVEFTNGDKSWYINGKWHREDGPAVEHADGYKWWFLNGIQYTELQWEYEMRVNG